MRSPTLRIASLAAALLIALAAPGCSSLEATFDKKKVHPYAGVTQAAELMGDFKHPVVFLIAGLDMPFSLIADTVFLPYTLPVWLRDRH